MSDIGKQFGDFASLRESFDLLSEIYRLNGKISFPRKGMELSAIPRTRWAEVSRGVRANEEMIRSLVHGSGQRASVQGRREVVLAVISIPGESAAFEVSAFLVVGRGAISDTITIRSDNPDWRARLSGFTDWGTVEGVVAAAEGNNQRAMIGLVLQLAGIGKGKIEIIEAELPDEIDEAAQSVRGADWMKAGLLRFRSAAGEALWYLMRIRSVHARMIRTRKQGYYTSMALAAMYASGMAVQEMVDATGMPKGLIDKLVPIQGNENAAAVGGLGDLGGVFLRLDSSCDARAAFCANRVWKGAAIYAHILDRRIRVGAQARARISEGDDLVSIAGSLRISRRDLIRVLSVRQSEAIAERERFVGAIIDPDLVKKVSTLSS